MYGHNSCQDLPYINSWAEAKARYEITVPIRGRVADNRPLGKRSAVDTYYITHDKVANTYSACLYKTKVLTYHENNNVVVDMGRWYSQTTCRFINAVLSGAGCYRRRGVTVLMLGGYAGAVVELGDKPTTIRRAEGGWLNTMPPSTEVRLVRKQANAARARYKAFTTYFKNTMKVRIGDKGDWVTINTGSAQDLTGNVTRNTEQLRLVRAWKSMHTDAATRSKFFELIANQGETEQDFEDFSEAVIALAVNTTGNAFQYDISVSIGAMLKAFNDLVLRHHSDEVFEVVPVAVNAVPNIKYRSYAKKAESLT